MLGIARYREPPMIVVVWSESMFKSGRFEALLTGCGLWEVSVSGL